MSKTRKRERPFLPDSERFSPTGPLRELRQLRNSTLSGISFFGQGLFVQLFWCVSLFPKRDRRGIELLFGS